MSGMEEQKHSGISARFVASAIIPLIVLGAMIAFLLWPGNSLLNIGTPLPQVSIERIEFLDNQIIAHIRNTGPAAIEVAQADVNDRIVPAAIEPSKTLGRLEEARVVIPFHWNAGQPYEIGVTTSEGTRFAKAVAAAAPTPQADSRQVGLFALLGTYVGIIPVLIGLLWYPFIRRLSQNKYNFFLSLTAGLLIFLGIDALVEANEISVENVAGAFKGQLLIATAAIVSFLALMYVSGRLVDDAGKKRAMQKSFAIALMVSIGIGLHNLGEGLAIGGAMVVGSVALSTFLIVGFTLHNTTEGLAIVAPMAKDKPRIRNLIALGIIAGAPAIAGAWIGGFVSSPVASIVFLAIGAGAVFQVVVAITRFVSSQSSGGKLLAGPNVAGLAVGILVMYVTALLV